MLQHKEIRIGTVLASGRGRKAQNLFMEDIVINRNLVLGSALLLPLFSAVPASAQRVRADIIVGGGPVAGRVLIGDRGGYDRPRRIGGFEWIRANDYDRDDWWRSFERDSRIVVVYWDPDEDAYYLDDFRSGLVEVRMYECDGRFYRLEENRYGGRIYDRYDPRWNVRLDYRNNGRFNGRYDGRYNDRYNERYDDRYHDRNRDRKHDRNNDRWNGRNDGRYNDRSNGRNDDRSRAQGQDNRRDDRKDGRDSHGQGRRNDRGGRPRA